MGRLKLVRKLNKAGVAYSLQGNDDEAIEIYSVALSIDPCCPYVHYNLATSYIKKGMELHAIEDLMRYLEYTPHAVDSHLVHEKIEKLRKRILVKEEKIFVR